MEWIIVRNNCYPLPLMSMIVLTTGCVLLVAGSWTCRHPEVECATFCQSSTPQPAPRSRRPPARLSGPSRPQPCGFSSDLTLSYNVTQTKLYTWIYIYQIQHPDSSLYPDSGHSQMSFPILSLYVTSLVLLTKLFFENYLKFYKMLIAYKYSVFFLNVTVETLEIKLSWTKCLVCIHTINRLEFSSWVLNKFKILKLNDPTRYTYTCEHTNRKSDY